MNNNSDEMMIEYIKTMSKNGLLDTDLVEVVRCKDCKWKQRAECVRFSDIRPFPNDFCSRAERREE